MSPQELLAAEAVLEAVSIEQAAEFQLMGELWDRDEMQKHVNERAAIIKARAVLIDRAEKLSIHQP